MFKLGILGGGQLGKMLAQAARKLEFPVEVSIYDTSDYACAREDADRFHRGSFEDIEAIQRFAKDLDIITYEFENIPVEVVASLSHAIQGSEALRILQNRLLEKEFIDSLPGIPCVPHAQVGPGFSMDYPFIVKTAQFGYDGKGQYLIKDADDLSHVKNDMVAERYFPTLTEYSMVIARSIDGTTTHYPTFENVHVDQILDTTRFATIDKGLEEQLFEKAKNIAQALDYIGVLTVEYFFTDGKLYVNEVAPRVHNSGHITLDAANISQFDLHLYSLLGITYPEITIDPDWCMVNVLGQHYMAVKGKSLPGKFYDYGKHSTTINRKVGHINGKLQYLDLLKKAREE